jgi:hypothetical protein
MVATLTKLPISDIKKTKIKKVPIDSNINQKVYPPNFLQPNKLSDLPIALGEASRQVSVVLNIVVNAAIAISKNIFSPKLDVYKLIS